MRIFDITKRIELTEEPNLELGYLKEDTLTIHHESVIGVEEQGHWITIAEYPNGGKDVEWVVDVEGVESKEAFDETEEIFVYIPYSEEQLLEIKKERYPSLVVSYIREKYSQDDEYAILRKKLAGIDANEFNEYNEFCEQCKARARQELGM